MKRLPRTLLAAILLSCGMLALGRAQAPSPPLAPIPPGPEIPVLDRIRGIERRPPTDDVAAFVQRLVDERANVITLGTMNGQGYAYFPTDLAPPHRRMDPDFLRQVIPELRERGIKVLSWVVFNAQDLRRVEDYQPVKRFPQWQMEYIEEPGSRPREKAGMCVVSSPYLEHHARLLRQAAAFDLDGFFFDGFYLGGIPHPARPGCVCQFCRKAFKKDTGLDLPAKVDWTDTAFKRWVRWRNERLLANARRLRDEIREVRLKATCTFNTNLWPFGNKDWETAVPMWRIDDLGVSQHGYSARLHEKWLMLGFKSRLGRDMNPRHCDMWRACGLRHTCGEKNPDWAWHELEILTHILSGLSHGITPWHSTVEGPVEITARIHTEAAKRERYFSREYVADVAVLASQNTHDFYGHIPGSENLAAYRDTLLGTWMLLSEEHVPFEFLFDNQQLDARSLGQYRVLVLPNAACLSDEAFAAIEAWVRGGGRLIATGETGAYDEWGRQRNSSLLVERLGLTGDKTPVKLAVGNGTLDLLPADPGLARCREHASGPDSPLVRCIRRAGPLPLEVAAPETLVANLFLSPADPNERWIHLLNVSHLGGTKDYRGTAAPAPKPSKPRGDGKSFGFPLVPARSVTLKLREGRPKAARLAVAGTDLAIDAEGRIAVPELQLHDVVVVTVE